LNTHTERSAFITGVHSEGYRREFVSLVKLAASLSPQAEKQVSQIAR